jgi:hypothetical protein
MRSATLLLALGMVTTVTGGCFPIGYHCPTGEDESPSVSALSGSMEAQDEAGPHPYALGPTTSGTDQCWLSLQGAFVEEGDIDGLVRPLLRITCGTSEVPELLVQLPDLRNVGPTAEPVAMTAEVTFGQDCAATQGDVPTVVSVVAAEGGGADEPDLVTDDYLRQFEATVTIAPGERAGARENGTPCVVDSPALEIRFQITMDSSDFGAGRSGCG